MAGRAWVLAAALALAACGGGRPATHPVTPGATAAKVPPGKHPYQVGMASFYSDKLAGRKTANGEKYDPRALTAAHRTLPLGTIVEVVYQGAHVQVRINDRGPFVTGRVLDLSRRAAQQLGIVRAGVAQVAIYVITVPRKAPASSPHASGRT